MRGTQYVSVFILIKLEVIEPDRSEKSVRISTRSDLIFKKIQTNLIRPELDPRSNDLQSNQNLLKI
jgi:hypothetical protein